MDKAWMAKDRLSHEFELGLESFLQFALQHATNPTSIPCPCTKCGNLWNTNINSIRAHVYCNGIDLTYKKWIWHGEESVLGDLKKENDAAGESENYFADKPIDMVHAAYESSENPDQFIKLLEDAEKPLYVGCTKFTKLSAIVQLYNLKAKYSWSDNSFTELLVLFGEMLPVDNELPLSLYDAKKSLCAMGMTYKKIHACPNDCVLYWKEYEDFTDCPTCGVSRWKLAKNSRIIEGVPAKILWYFPPIPRFQRMFRSKEISKELIWHANKRVCDAYMRHPADAPCWRLVDHNWPNFASETRNLRLAIAADGINPHSLMSSTYSCWPVIMITYNLPPWLCMKRKYMMLTLLIFGPKQPGNDIDVYLAPLIDDLKELWEVGVEAYDAHREERFLLRAVLLWTINDFPAYGNLAGCTVKGYQACPICGEKTCAKRLKHNKKMSFTGHRRFLRRDHPYRRQKKAFDGTQDFTMAPKPLSGDEVLKKVEGITCRWGKIRANFQSKENDGKSCWKKNRYSLNLSIGKICMFDMFLM